MSSTAADAPSDVQALEERRDALVARLSAIRADLARGFDRDGEERAVELENFDVLNEIARVAEEDLERVEARLEDARRAAAKR